MALLFEKTCRANGLMVKIVPVPRQISSSCGLACSFPCEREDEVKEIAESKQIDVDGYHYLQKQG